MAELSRALPVLESRDDMFDRGSGAFVASPNVVFDDAPVGAWLGCFDFGDALVAAVAERAWVVVESVAEFSRATTTLFRLPGQVLLTVVTVRSVALMMIWVLTDRW